jgi:hypothetical protein
MVRACRIDAMFVRNYFPELCPDLIPALATLDVHKLAHGFLVGGTGLCGCAEDFGRRTLA